MEAVSNDSLRGIISLRRQRSVSIRPGRGRGAVGRLQRSDAATRTFRRCRQRGMIHLARPRSRPTAKIPTRYMGD